MKINKCIAVLAGDGIGPEIVPAVSNVLEAVGKLGGHSFEFIPAAVGGQAIDDTGWPLPDETLNLAKSSDAVLLGAVGGPKWEGLEYERRPERALLGLREKLGLFANLRPAKLYSELLINSIIKSKEQHENVAYSPICIHLMLALIMLGSHGKTKTELIKVAREP